MRRGAGLVLIGLGAFLLVLAPLLRFWAAPQLAVAPLGCEPEDVLIEELCDNGISLSPSEGEAAAIFNVSRLAIDENVELDSVRRIKPDREASSDETAVYESNSTTTRANGDLVVSNTERIPFNRHDSIMDDCCDANVNGVDITDFEGLNPYKFPFFTEKDDYLYFDATLRQALPAQYVGEEELHGLNVYKFEQVIEPTEYAELEVPGDLVGSDEASFVAPRFYSNTRTFWVEPTTGVIVKGMEQQRQYLAGPDGDPALTLFDAELAFTEDNQLNAANNAKEGKASLDLVRTTIPLIALPLGLLLLGIGLFLVLGGSRRGTAEPVAAGTGEPVSPSY